MKRFIWLPVAGFLLIAGAAVAAAGPGLIGSTPASSTLAVGESDESAADPSVAFGGSALLEDVLADLVGDGVITQEQSDAIVSAVDTRVEERREEIAAERERMREMWLQIRSFLEDGVISAEEIAQLPDGNPFDRVSDILADGQVTLEEIRSLGPFGRPGPGFGPRGGHGPHGPGFWLDAPATEEASPST